MLAAIRFMALLVVAILSLPMVSGMCDEGGPFFSRLQSVYIDGYPGYKIVTANAVANSFAAPRSRVALHEGDKVAISGHQLTNRGGGWADVYENGGGSAVKVKITPNLFDNRTGHGLFVLGTVMAFPEPTK